MLQQMWAAHVGFAWCSTLGLRIFGFRALGGLRTGVRRKVRDSRGSFETSELPAPRSDFE